MSEPSSAHWSRQKEKVAGYWHLKLLLVMFRFLPVIILRVLAFPVGFFYFLFSKSIRTASRLFLSRVASFTDDDKMAKKCRSPIGPLRHIISFSLNMVEKLEAWGGKFRHSGIHYHDDEDDINEFVEGLDNGKGAFLISSHLGNMELLRGLVGLNRTRASRNIAVSVIMNVEVSSQFDRMLKELNMRSSFDIINANDMGPHTAAILEEKLASGQMITSAGDRTPVNGAVKTFLIPFLGEEAPFGNGIFYLTVLLNAPVYFVFALRRKDLSLKPEYDMYVHKFSPPASGTAGRKERLEASHNLARSFAGYLERYCKEHPFQWYNFYDFWAKEG